MASTYLGAFGIGVSDLEKSADFYTGVVGMKQLMTLEPENMKEIVLGFEGRGASLLLMHYTDGSNPNYSNNPVKVVLYVPDANAIMTAAQAAGAEVVRDLSPVAEIGNALVGMVKDPDGYVVEFVQKAQKA